MLTAVMGARGGVGATTLAVALARSLVASVLIDVDGLGGGLDAWLGIEEVPGVRWSGLRLGGGELAAADLLAALPRLGDVGVLAADRADEPEPSSLAQLLDVVADTAVVVDLPRRLDDVTATVLERCGLLVLVTPASVPGAVAAHTLARALGGAVPIGAVVVGEDLPGAAVQAATGLPVLAVARDVRALGRAAAGIALGISG